jgi:hypothetical protein
MTDNQENKIRELIAGLNSSNQDIVSGTLDELRDFGKVEILPDIFALYFSGRMPGLSTDIINLLSDIKDPKAVPFFGDAIKKYRGMKGFDQLVSSCWQNGLDYTSLIDQFIELILEEDYYTSLEAFTVIEENIPQLSSQQRTARLEFVRSKLEFLSPEKRQLVNQMISVLSSVSGPLKLDPEFLN